MGEGFNNGMIMNMTEPLFDVIKEYLDAGTGSVYVVSPFISNETIERLLSDVGPRGVSIVTSWKPEHLMDGVSSLKLYDICKKHGWKLYVNNHLHAKFYSDSFNSIIITSANCTDAALNRVDGNIEGIVLKKHMDRGNRIELNKLIACSTCVDDRIFEQYAEWFNNNCQEEFTELEDFKLCDITPFYTFQLPATCNPDKLWDYVCGYDFNEEELSLIEHDLAIYYTGNFNDSTYDSFINNLRANFIKHPFIKMLEQEITSAGVHFGTFKAHVQNDCSDVPVPFRSKLTTYVQNLFKWFVVLFPELYDIDVPGRHSQRLYRK